MNTAIKLPFYVKITMMLLGLSTLVMMLYIAQDIIIPLIYATIIAILISPAVRFLEKRKFNRLLAVACVFTVLLALVILFAIWIVSQASLIRDALPVAIDKFEEMLNQGVRWASGYFNIRVREINEWLAQQKTAMLESGNMGLGQTISTMGGIMATVFLTPVYIFMILFYQPHLIRFVHQLFGKGNNGSVSEILIETKGIIQSYLVGLSIEVVIIVVLNSLGLLILGFEYAILLGIVGALLNIIPYLGGLIAVLLYMLIALVTLSPQHALYVAGLYTVIQFVDNNFLVPKIVGSKVKLNALVSIIAVICGGALWGIPGMFLSIPLTAVIKLILDRSETSKAWGFLLGDSMPAMIKIKKT